MRQICPDISIAMSSPTGNNTTLSIEEEQLDETRWTDDRIRDLYDSSDDDDVEDDDPIVDIFKDPDPTQIFSFRFPYPDKIDVRSNNNCNSESDADAFINIELQGYKAESDEIWKSTGLTLWRAAELLCDYMVLHPKLLENKRIVELGAGLGLCGILAHRMATSSTVLLTDGDTDALVQLRGNVERNSSVSAASMGSDSQVGANGNISCRQLIWGSQTSEEFLERYAEGRTFDVLLASDIVYAAVVIEPLWETVQTLLSKEGVFLFGYCSKRKVPITIDVVTTAADEAGFSYKCIDDKDGVLVYIFKWKEE